MPRAMELTQLRALIATVDHGSFLEAGRALSIPSSSLRARIQALEKVIGAPLLVRSNRGVGPTDAGRVLLEGARRLVAEADQLLAAARCEVHEGLGQLRIRLPSGPPPMLARILLPALWRQYPKLRVQLDTTADTLAELTPDVDIVVHFGEAVPSGLFVTARLRVEALRLMASAAYLRRRGRPESPAALRDHAILLWTPQGGSTHTLPVVGAAPLPIEPMLCCADISLVRAAAAAGQGIAWLPAPAATLTPNHFETLEILLADQVVGTQEVRVLVPMRASATARSRAVLELLRQLGRDLPDGLGDPPP